MKPHKSNIALARDLGKSKCDSCGAEDVTVHYDYVTRTGKILRKCHCIGCKQTAEQREERLNGR